MQRRKQRHKVHVRDQHGRVIFNRLWNDGSPVFKFESKGGFVDRLVLDRRHDWILRDGWPSEKEARSTWEDDG